MGLTQQDLGACNCGCLVHVCVTSSCTGTALAGVTVTIHGTTGTTDGTGCVDIDVGTAGSWAWSISATGFRTLSGTAAFVCGGTFNRALCPGQTTVTATNLAHGGGVFATETLTFTSGCSWAVSASGLGGPYAYSFDLASGIATLHVPFALYSTSFFTGVIHSCIPLNVDFNDGFGHTINVS